MYLYFYFHFSVPDVYFVILLLFSIIILHNHIFIFLSCSCSFYAVVHIIFTSLILLYYSPVFSMSPSFFVPMLSFLSFISLYSRYPYILFPYFLPVLRRSFINVTVFQVYFVCFSTFLVELVPCTYLFLYFSPRRQGSLNNTIILFSTFNSVASGPRSSVDG
jgi:hypothetical protein